MSFVLNVFNDTSKKLEEFSLKGIEVFVDNKEQNWFKRAHVGTFLVLRHIDTSLEGLDKCEILQQKILRLNKEIDGLIKNRHVPRLGYLDNVLCFIKKNSMETHPYYAILRQYRQLENFLKSLKLCYPNMEEAERCDDPNATHRWNIFNSEVIEKPNYYKNHFSLTEEK